jgi:hypothetical protein
MADARISQDLRPAPSRVAVKPAPLSPSAVRAFSEAARHVFGNGGVVQSIAEAGK